MQELTIQCVSSFGLHRREAHIGGQLAVAPDERWTPMAHHNTWNAIFLISKRRKLWFATGGWIVSAVDAKLLHAAPGITSV
mmetsp:Transcript_26449/g.65455  ORF Transcript_26449/g.65455 Transcript_26449/m.65455 type:complete len:81 (-) Transcript_26449:168-410(-)